MTAPPPKKLKSLTEGATWIPGAGSEGDVVPRQVALIDAPAGDLEGSLVKRLAREPHGFAEQLLALRQGIIGDRRRAAREHDAAGLRCRHACPVRVRERAGAAAQQDGSALGCGQRRKRERIIEGAVRGSQDEAAVPKPRVRAPVVDLARGIGRMGAREADGVGTHERSYRLLRFGRNHGLAADDLAVEPVEHRTGHAVIAPHHFDSFRC